jgi:hypothetical protein
VVKIADDRWTTWQAEQAGTNRGPSIGSVLLLLAVVAALLIALASAGGGQAGAVEPDGRSLCEEHPRWSVCQESAKP